MGFMDQLVSGGTNSGMNFRGVGAPLTNAVTGAQTSQAYDNTQQGLQQQQAFINALQAQNGIGNQSSVFNQQQNLANQLQGVANGTGPNPAQAALQQATAANTANQAALMAGQRGAGSNVGLMARQAAQQGAANQQQAVGQGAQMQAQQQLAGMNALSGQQQAMGNTAGNMVNNQAGAIQGYNQYAQNEQNNLLNAVAQYNNSQVGMQSNMNNVNAGIAGHVAEAQQNLLGGAVGGGSQAAMAKSNGTESASPASAGAAGAGAAHGGVIRKMADGGMANPLASQSYLQDSPDQIARDAAMQSGGNANAVGPKSKTAQILKNPQSFVVPGSDQQSGAYQTGSGLASLIGQGVKAMAGMAHGGKVPVVLSPGEIRLSPEQAQAVAEGQAEPKKVGKKVPGKAEVKGDSLKNDTVRTALAEGSVVVPRSKSGDDDKAAAFVARVLAKQGLKKK